MEYPRLWVIWAIMIGLMLMIHILYGLQIHKLQIKIQTLQYRQEQLYQNQRGGKYE